MCDTYLYKALYKWIYGYLNIDILRCMNIRMFKKKFGIFSIKRGL